MASIVKSGSSNVTYTNNTVQNVRIVINYLDNPTSITWEDVTIAIDDTFGIAKPYGTNPAQDSRSESGWYTRSAAAQNNPFSNIRELVIKVNNQVIIDTTNPSSVIVNNQYALVNGVKYYPRTYRGSVYGWPGGGPGDNNNGFDISIGNTHYPKQIMLNPGKSFSAICGAYNIVIIKEDGT